MRLLAAILVGLLAAGVFSISSDHLVLSVRDLLKLDLGIDIYSIMASTRNLGSFIAGVLGMALGYLTTDLYEKTEKRSFRLSLASGFFVAGLLITIVLSIISASFAATIAGVQPGGWNWQFLPAIYGGGFFGLIGYCIAYPVIWQRRGEAVSSFSISSFIVPAAIFVLSFLTHAFLLSQKR
jgi:hypothetical protein